LFALSLPISADNPLWHRVPVSFLHPKGQNEKDRGSSLEDNGGAYTIRCGEYSSLSILGLPQDLSFSTQNTRTTQRGSK
jgi:hypothetical protein